MSTPILDVQDLGIRFGGLAAVDGLTFSVQENAIHGLIGPNGAGKTTTFNLISGFYRHHQGKVRLRGKVISGLHTFEIARLGLVRTFQHSTLFAEMTVFENALVGTHMACRPRFFASLARQDRAVRQEASDRASKSLEFFGLQNRLDERAGDLSHGHQRALGLAIASASNPSVLLLDEPFTGMNKEETGTMMDLMFRLRERGMTILLVEHDMHAVMGLCDQITVVNFGKLLAEGAPADIRSHPGVIEAYLGRERHAA